MASLMAPSVAPSAGVTQRLNSFESNLSAVKESARDYRQSLGQFDLLAKNVLQYQLAAHNAANDAKVTDYSLRLQRAHTDILNELKTKANKDAIDARDGVLKALGDVEQQLSSELQNEDPSVIEGFKQRAQKTLFTSQTNADAYVMEQSIKYRDTQRAAQIENLAQNLAMNMENPVMYSKALEDFREARALQDDELGIEAGSDTSKAMSRKVTDDIYGSEITKLIGLKRFGAADKALNDAARNEFINANTYNKALVNLVTSREAAARQAEIDAQRRARFRAAQAKTALDIENAKLLNAKRQYDLTQRELKAQYGALADYEENAMMHMYAQKMDEAGAFKQIEVKEIDPETGEELTKVVELSPDERQRKIKQAAVNATLDFKTQRNMQASAELDSLNIIADAARIGHGDSVMQKAMDAYERMPDGPDKMALGDAIAYGRKNLHANEIEARITHGFDVSKPGDTALALDALEYMSAADMPTDMDGNLDSFELRKKLSARGIENYSYMEIRAAANKKLQGAKDAREGVYSSKDFVTLRNSALTAVGDTLLSEGILDDDRFSFDPSDANSNDPEDRQKYAAGRFILRQTLDEYERRAKAILDPAERQSSLLMSIQSAETKTLLKNYAERYADDFNLMSNDERKEYDEKRINAWKARQ